MWYVIQTMAGSEEEVRRQAQLLIPEVEFRILYRIGSFKFRGEWTTKSLIMFPGYIFVITDDPSSVMMKLRKIEKFARMVKFDDMFIPVSAEEQRILSRMSGDDDTIDTSTGIIEGDRIVVKEGPLIGLESRIKRIDRHKRLAYVGFSMGSRDVEVELGLSIIEKIEAT